MRRFSVACRTQ